MSQVHRIRSNSVEFQVMAGGYSSTPYKKWQLTLACLTSNTGLVNNLFFSAFLQCLFHSTYLSGLVIFKCFNSCCIMLGTIFKLPHERERWGPEIVGLNFNLSQWKLLSVRPFFSDNRKIYSIAHSPSFTLPCIFCRFCFIWIDDEWYTKKKK